MTQELYIENYRLDITNELSTLLTFEIDNIKTFASRSTTWSKTVVLPGTSNNNKLFGHIFEIGQSNPYNPSLDNVGINFNASKSANCILFQDQMQTFKGVIRLLQINIDKGRAEYEVALFGKVANLNVSLSSLFLHDLDFSAYDHVYNATNITSSWSATPGTGYYYPHIDYGTYSQLKKDWDIRTFRPALYVREYIDKIMTGAGFRWSSDLFDTPRFKRLIIPHNTKSLMTYSTALVNASAGTQTSEDSPYAISFGTVIGGGFTAGAGNTEFTFTGAVSVTANIDFIVVANVTGFFNFPITLRILKNGTPVYSNMSPVDSATWNDTIQTTVAPGDIIKFEVTFFDAAGYELTVNGSFSIDSTTPTLVEIGPNDDVEMNSVIPKNIRQIDFLSSIIKLSNLYVYEDKYDNTLIHFTPYIDYYSTSATDSVDWSKKLNRDKVLKVRPMSELTSRKYEFRFRPDNDHFNEIYRKRYNQGYGDYVFDSLYEFAEEPKTIDLIFSATPLVGYSGEDKIYPTIFKQSAGVEERIDCNIRIMLSKRITGVASWALKDGVTTITTLTEYGYAGHFDDPDAPSNDLNFGVLSELFFVLAAGDLTATQFNVYWSSYMAEITDKDSKLLEGFFLLTLLDILNLDFSKKVMVDGVLFRLNSVQDYNMTMPMDCVVQLLKINYLTY